MDTCWDMYVFLCFLQRLHIEHVQWNAGWIGRIKFLPEFNFVVLWVHILCVLTYSIFDSVRIILIILFCLSNKILTWSSWSSHEKQDVTHPAIWEHKRKPSPDMTWPLVKESAVVSCISVPATWKSYLVPMATLLHNPLTPHEPLYPTTSCIYASTHPASILHNASDYQVVIWTSYNSSIDCTPIWSTARNTV